MLTTNVTFEGTTATEVRVRGSSGTTVAEVVVLVDEPTSTRDDTVPTRHRVVAFGALADNLTVCVTKGDRILVAGRLATDTRSDGEGQKHDYPYILADAIGISLRWTTATPQENPGRRATAPKGSDSTPMF